MFSISPLFFILPVMLITVGELILSTSWTPFFFRFGIPLFRKEFSVLNTIVSLDDYIRPLENQLPRSWQRPSIVFKAISQHELAFRQKFGQRSNPAHGHLIYNAQRQRLSFTGYLPWSTLIFPLVFIVVFLWIPVEAVFLFLSFFMVALGFGIFMSRRNYGRISQAIEYTFQEQITNEKIFATLEPQLINEYVPENPTYDYENDSYSSLNKQSDNSNTATIILVVVLVGLLIILGIVSAIFFLMAFA